MGDRPVRLKGLRSAANVLCVAGVTTGVALAVVPLVLILQSPHLLGSVRAVLLAIGGVLGGVLVAVGSVSWRLLMSLLLKVEANTFRSHDVLLDVRETLSAQQARLDEIAENVQLSDAAKSIARREKERDALREAISEEILRGNWDAAYYLVDELERRFGYRAEAERLRKEVDHWRTQAIEDRQEQAIRQVEEAIDKCDWQRARVIAERLRTVFADDERVKALPERIQKAFEQKKQQLLGEWREAVDRHDIDRSLELLKELDRYLTSEEARELREPARAVFRERLQQLGAQFTMAYKEKDWARAIEIGEQIMTEFPNSKMSSEVRELMDDLRARAASA